MEPEPSSPGLDGTSDSKPVVSAFVACGVAPGPLEPLLAGRRAAPADLVIDDVAVVLKGEECPPGYELLEHTPDGQRASLNHGDVLGKQIFLAIRRLPLAEAARPLTGLALIFADRGEEPPPGFEPVRRTVGGLGASLISVAPYTAVRFGAYDILNRSAAFEWLPGVARVAGCGMVAGLCASAATFPFEVARRRAMTGVGAANPFTSMVQIYKTEGVRYGLYKGYGVNVVKVVPSTAITFTVYEKMRTALDRLASAWSPTKLRPQTPSEQDETLEEVIPPTLPGSSAAFAAARRRRLRRPA